MKQMDNRNEGRIVVPACQIAEDEGQVFVKLEMPGVAKEGLDVQIEGNALTITGKRSDEEPRGKWLLRERRLADYRKVFTIDETIDRDGISAGLADGVLTLGLKVKEAAKPRRIEIA